MVTHNTVAVCPVPERTRYYISLCLAFLQDPESVAEKEVRRQEWHPHHLTCHSKCVWLLACCADEGFVHRGWKANVVSPALTCPPYIYVGSCGRSFRMFFPWSLDVLPYSRAPPDLFVICPLRPNQVFFYNLIFWEIWVILKNLKFSELSRYRGCSLHEIVM